jgi:TonB family protein
MNRTILLPLFFLAACVPSQQSIAPTDRPEIVSMSSLPVFASPYAFEKLKLNVFFLVRKDGSVSDVQLVRSSGDPLWDRAAIDSMKQWHFAASLLEGAMTDRWVRSTVIVQIEEPTIIALAELRSDTRTGADSLYALLQAGVEFETLVTQAQLPGSTVSGKNLGITSIARFPQHVREQLRRLGMNDITPPLRIGNSYVIFKRLDLGSAANLPLH